MVEKTKVKRLKMKRKKAEAEWIGLSPEEYEKYRGRWIAWVDDRVVAHGVDFGKVYDEGRKFSPMPVMEWIPVEEVVVYEAVHRTC